MATATIYPVADITANFDTTFPASPTTHFSKIDEVTPDDADYNETTTGDDIDEVDLGDTPANLSQLTQATFPLRGYLDDASATALFRCSLWRSGPTQVGGDIDVDGTDFPAGYGTTVSVFNVVWSGLTLTKAQADTLSFRYQFKTAP